MNLTAIVAAAAATAAIAFGAGAKVGQWRAEASCTRDAADLRDRIILMAEEQQRLVEQRQELELVIADLNADVRAAAAQAEAAEQARRAAEKHAADLASFSQSRLDKLQLAFESATSCDEVLRSYWELRK